LGFLAGPAGDLQGHQPAAQASLGRQEHSPKSAPAQLAPEAKLQKPIPGPEVAGFEHGPARQRVPVVVEEAVGLDQLAERWAVREARAELIEINGPAGLQLIAVFFVGQPEGGFRAGPLAAAGRPRAG
jgi:hypothetical protein